MKFQKIFGEMNSVGVEYLVVGGVALNLLGYFRATADLDIILLLEDDNLGKFIKLVKGWGLKPRIPVSIDDFAKEDCRKSWINEKNMKAFALYDPSNWVTHIDVVIEHPLDFAKAYKNKETFEDGDLKIPVVSIEDLITMKNFSGRERDLSDIKALERIRDLRNEKQR